MDKAYFRILFHPEVRSPIFVEGLPGLGNVGRIATRLLIEFTHARPFAELYSPSFPDHVFVDRQGICRPPRYDFYSSSTGENHFIVLVGDAQPSFGDVLAYYTLCDEILDFVEGYGCRFVVTMDGVPSPNPDGEVFVASSSSRLTMDFVKKGAKIYSHRRIVGTTGLLLGLAKRRGLEGVCLLGETSDLKSDRKAAFSIFKFLMKTLGTDVGTGFQSENEL